MNLHTLLQAAALPIIHVSDTMTRNISLNYSCYFHAFRPKIPAGCVVVGWHRVDRMHTPLIAHIASMTGGRVSD